jgi:hypothetical protein
MPVRGREQQYIGVLYLSLTVVIPQCDCRTWSLDRLQPSLMAFAEAK